MSGAKVPFGERPGGARLLGDLKSGDRVLVTKIDRAARSVPDLLSLVADIEERGCSIRFVDQDIDTSGAFGRFFLVLLAAIAEREAAIVSERRMESLESFKEQGRHAVGKPPYGFTSVERDDGRGLVIRPDPETGPKVLAAITRVLAGEPQDLVRHDLGLSKTGFHKLLRNPRLAGMVPEGRYETYRDAGTGKRKSRLVDVGVVMVDGLPRTDKEAALLSLAEGRALQDYLGTPDKKWTKQGGYGAALTCGVCGDRMYKNIDKRANAATGGTHDTYVCRRVRHAAGEGAPSVMVHKADVYLEGRFLEMFGYRRVITASWSDSGDLRAEAVSAAAIALDEAQRQFAAAATEDDERDAVTHMQAAKRALREAHAIPDRRVSTYGDFGQTVAEVWAAVDYAERCRLLSRHAVGCSTKARRRSTNASSSSPMMCSRKWRRTRSAVRLPCSTTKAPTCSNPDLASRLSSLMLSRLLPPAAACP